jgi:hypothetical protein
MPGKRACNAKQMRLSQIKLVKVTKLGFDNSFKDD